MDKSNEKYTQLLGYKPSEYQNKIFNFVEHNVGNAVIQARAGSGKTATIITSMKLVPKNKKCLFLAFNTSVKDEITKKLSDYSNCTIQTVHGLGFSILSTHFHDKEFNIDKTKYVTYLRQHIEELSTATFKNPTQYTEFINNVLELLNFARMDLSQSVREINRSAEKRSLQIKFDEDKVVYSLMKWGKGNIDTIDYTDMVWLPNELRIMPKSNRYDWIFNDEAQDYTIAYVELFLKCFKRGTRFISCGDEFQAINEFAGASKTAFNKMINYPNTQIFFLPISYRCDKAIITEAQRYVPDIEARPNAGTGLIKFNSKIAEINNDDMILSRTNAPLFKLYDILINKGKPCYIKGQENDSQKLINLINNIISSIKNEEHKNNLSPNFESDGLFPRLYLNLINKRNQLVNSGISDIDVIHSDAIQNMYDTIHSLLILSKNCNTVDELINKIQKIFKDKGDGICLSTIHKAKGLESNYVHILCRSELPNKYAKTESAIIQERNLLYVAITRAKNKLCYIDEKEFPPMKIFAQSDNSEINEFDLIEANVNKLYSNNELIITAHQSSTLTDVTQHFNNLNKKIIDNKLTSNQTSKDKLLSKLLQ